MKRAALLGVMLSVVACGPYEPPGESSYTERPPKSDGSPGDVVCGLPGELGRLGFSYVYCGNEPRINGKPFGQPAAAGSTFPIYIDSRAKLVKVVSSNPDVATAELMVVKESSKYIIEVSAKAPGTTKFTLENGGKPSVAVVDRFTLGVVSPSSMQVTGIPNVETFALLDDSSLRICVQALTDDVPLVGGNMVQVESSEDVSIRPDEDSCRDSDRLLSPAAGEGFRITPYSKDPEEVTVELPGIGRKQFKVARVRSEDLTDIVFSRSRLVMEQPTVDVPVSVTIMAGNLPVLGAKCDVTLNGETPSYWNLRGSYDALTIRERFYFSARNLKPGTYQLTCSVDGGRLTKSLPITIR